MIKFIINNLLFYSFGIFFYLIGIFIKYLNLNLFETYLFTTNLIIIGFFSSCYLCIFDNIHPYKTLNNIYDLPRKKKIILYLSCIPYYKLLILSYIDTDPIIIQLINSTRIALNVIIYSFYYKEYYICNIIIIINIILNIFACIFPFLFKNNTINFGLHGIIITIISVILTCFNNILNEKIEEIYDFNNMYGYNTFIVFTFIITDLLFSLLLIPLIALISYYNNNNLILIDNFYKIITFSSIIGLFYGSYFIIITKSYLQLTSINISIINNIVFISIIFISCILQISQFNYFYILSIIIIIISSLIIIYKLKLLKNNIVSNLSIT